MSPSLLVAMASFPSLTIFFTHSFLGEQIQDTCGSLRTCGRWVFPCTTLILVTQISVIRLGNKSL